MDSRRYERLKEHFDAASDLSPDDRATYVLRLRSVDAALADDLAALLDTDASRSQDELFRILEQNADDRPTAPDSPRRIGPYRVRRVVGRGGMGTVYEATREETGERVAVKVLTSGPWNPAIEHRFRRETEILERMGHRGIARLFAAGEFEHGGRSVPYFAMEFVDGPRLLDYARERRLDVTAKVDLFVRICDAVHHAHLRGVVHRDLKPDNILVVDPDESSGDVGQPKVLDFGVGRFADLGKDVTRTTDDGQVIGSVRYMSPEQAAGRLAAIGPASDVYSLGVVLFELLTGASPYDVADKSFVEAVGIICREPPRRARVVRPDLARGLDKVCRSCMEKTPERRYPSAAIVAEELNRHLAGKRVRGPRRWGWALFKGPVGGRGSQT